MKFAAARTKKGQTVEQEGIEGDKRPASHGSGIYHSIMEQHDHESEYAASAGSIPNPTQHKFPANKEHGGKTTAKRKGNKGL